MREALNNMDNRNKEPRTIREKLEAITNFRPAMQGGSSLSTYVPAQPNTIGRDPLVGSDIGRLVDALRPWDKALDRAYEAHIDRRILEDKASAELFKAEHPGMTKNIEAFRQAALADPNVLNLSPHVKKAIEGEILKGNAIQFAASLEDAYSTSDIRNERDPAKVMAWSEEQRKLYMQQQGLDKYDDKFMLAEHFAHPTARMLDGILARHSKDVESQNANLLEQQKAQNIQNILAMKQDLTSPLGGRDTKIPSDRVAYAQEAASAIMGEVEEMKRLGYSQDRVVGFLGKVVLHGNHSSRTARQLAQAITVDVNGQKVSLMSQPGIAKGIEQLEEQETERAWKAETRSHTRLQWQREESARSAITKGYEYGAKGSADLSRAEVVDRLKLCSPEDYPHFKKAAEDGQKGQFKSMYANPQLTTAALTLESDLKQGKAGKAQVMYLAQEGYDPTQVQRLLAIADSNSTAEGQAILTAQANLSKTYISMVGDVSAEEAADIYHSYNTGSSKKPTAGILAQVMMDLPDVNTAFADFVAEKKKERAAAKTDPREKDAPLTALDMQRFTQEFQGQFLDKRIKATKERFATEKAEATDNKQTRSYLTNLKNMEVTGGSDNSFFPSRSRPAQVEVVNGTINHINTLFGDSIAKDPTAAQQLNSAKTLQDVLRFADSRVEGGLTWQEMYFIVRGENPEARGIKDARAAQMDIYNWFKEKGIKASPPPAATAKPGAAAKFTRQIEVR
ncbi:MAG: hypothetical protein BCS36_03225 [Desulfovibrio sp. MES5]|nr:MAG: hypothetical protein BCS36_03225 [Desulfovibrio sp. MES5]